MTAAKEALVWILARRRRDSSALLAMEEELGWGAFLRALSRFPRLRANFSAGTCR